MYPFRKAFSLLLIVILVFQFSQSTANVSDQIIIKEGKLEEYLLEEQFIYESYLEPQYIYENVKYEDGIYEYIIPEQFQCETFLYEITITPETITNLVEILPPQLNDYNIDWPGVIAKFAIGTTIIISVGVLHWLTKGVSSFFIMASPGKVAKDAFVGGVIGTVMNLTINEIKNNGSLPDQALCKYAIEGFAEGYMWGAITSVLKVEVKNLKRLYQFKKATGGLLKLKLNGEVLDQSGNIIGKAYYDSSNVWHLVNESANTTTIFDSTGKELSTQVGTVLPANNKLSLGSGTTAHVCYTDESGIIYRVDDTLKPNITYKLGNNVYSTDSKGRIIRVEFNHLELKDPGRPRWPIADTMKAIGKNNAKVSDQRGHLIADQFNGNNTMANIVPQSQKVNQSLVKEIENTWADALQEGNNVSGFIQISYKGSSFRPSSFNYTYDCGSGLIEKIIPNK